MVWHWGYFSLMKVFSFSSLSKIPLEVQDSALFVPTSKEFMGDGRESKGRHVKPDPPPQLVSVLLMGRFFFLIKVDDEQFMLEEISPIFDFSNVNFINFYTTVNQLSGLYKFKPSGCFNGRKMQSSWGFTSYVTWWIHDAPYGRTWFSLHENYKCPLWTLPFQSLKPSSVPA